MIQTLRERIRLLVLLAVLGAGGLAWGGHLYFHNLLYESTDNAFIEGDVIAVAPKVAGHITALHVTDNQIVPEGGLLCEIDPRDYQMRVEEARAGLSGAQAQWRTAEANLQVVRTQAAADVAEASSAVRTARARMDITRDKVNQAQAAAAAARAALDNARALVKAAEAEQQRAAADLARFQKLDPRALSRQEYDLASSAAVSSDAQLEAARKRVTAEEAALEEARAAYQLSLSSVKEAESQVAESLARYDAALSAPGRIAAAEAEVEQWKAETVRRQTALAEAELNLSYTRITAPRTGRVTRRSIERGAYVVPGQAMLALVPQDLWVVANFKETQLTDMKPGQDVTIRVDTYPDHLLRGKVDSLQAGTGARFSLLPPENAIGNYVKVVQRVPVKIVFTEPLDPALHLGPGMSVVPHVRVR
ncbi:MAG: HlyD family secretion protein [bacterium]